MACNNLCADILLLSQRVDLFCRSPTKMARRADPLRCQNQTAFVVVVVRMNSAAPQLLPNHRRGITSSHNDRTTDIPRSRAYLLPRKLIEMFLNLKNSESTVGTGYCDYRLVTKIGYCDFLPALIWFSDRINYITLWQISDIVTVLAMSRGSHNIPFLLYIENRFRDQFFSLSQDHSKQVNFTTNQWPNALQCNFLWPVQDARF